MAQRIMWRTQKKSTLGWHVTHAEKMEYGSVSSVRARTVAEGNGHASMKIEKAAR